MEKEINLELFIKIAKTAYVKAIGEERWNGFTDDEKQYVLLLIEKGARDAAGMSS